MRMLFRARRTLRMSLFCVACVPSMVHAQSSVTLYGIIDSGVDYVTNSAGHKLVAEDSGILSPNLFGFRGTEDLGGGLSAVFNLLNQFDTGSGASIGTQFGREAYVGLQSVRWGKLTFGNQPDFMFTSLTVTRYGPAFPYIVFTALRQGPFNALAIPGGPTGAFDFDRMAGLALNNTVKYTSPDINGFSFGGMYGFGGQAGSFGLDSSQSVGMDYVRGPLSIDAAYTYVKYPTLDNGGTGIRNWGLGGHYIFSTSGVLDAVYTQTDNVLSGGRVNVFEAGFTQPIANVMTVAFDYEYMIGNAALNKNHAHQLNLTLDHSLSKRTDVYLNVGYQHASGDEGAQILGVDTASTSRNQAIFRAGMRHFF